MVKTKWFLNKKTGNKFLVEEGPLCDRLTRDPDYDEVDVEDSPSISDEDSEEEDDEEEDSDDEEEEEDEEETPPAQPHRGRGRNRR